MTKDEDFKLLKIQTFVLRVNIHCDGCKRKVKKLLQRIEGVFQVNIDSEQQKVTVSGSVDSATLIKRLVRAGKHAELWSAKSTQNQKQKNNYVKEEKINNKVQKQHMPKGLEAFRNQHKLSSLSFEEDEDYSDDDDDEEEQDGFRLIREKANTMNLLKQRGLAGKKGGVAIFTSGNDMKAINNGGIESAGKKMNQNHNLGIKTGPSGSDQRTIAALKMNNSNLGDARKLNDLSAMMNLADFQGNAPNIDTSGLGLNSNNLGGFQLQSNNVFPNPSSADINYTCDQYPSSMVMNMNRNQPQMMYHKSPLIPPNTGYYYNPYPQSESTGNSGDHSAAYMFSDGNTSGCSIM